MTFVYILSDHEEDGAENVCATLDRERLHALLDENWPQRTMHQDYYARWSREAHTGLLHHLTKPDEVLAAEPSGWNCNDGWGGVQLHVVVLR